jgi:hypothetical protein
MMYASRFRLLPVVAALALTGLTASAAHADTKRLVWTYSGGFFRDDGNGQWTEKNASGDYHFREAGRNREFIELRDDSRDCTVRLYCNAMFLKGFNGQHPNFIKFYEGHWTG